MHRQTKLSALVVPAATALALSAAGPATADAASSKIMVSSSPKRSHAVKLHRRTLSGRAYVFVASQDARRVRFYLDDTRRKHRPYRVDGKAPFDLRRTARRGAARPLDTRRLRNGRHTMTVSVRKANGKVAIYSAWFRVKNVKQPKDAAAATPAPSPSPKPKPTPTPTPAPSSPSMPTPPPPDGGVVKYETNFENGSYAPWYMQAAPGSAQIVTPPNGTPHQGSKAMRFTLSPNSIEPDTGNVRSELSSAGFYHPTQGTDEYYHHDLYIPSSTVVEDLSWFAIWQFKESTDNGSPPLQMMLLGPNYSGQPGGGISVQSGDSSNVIWRPASTQRDHWYEITYHVRWDSNPSAGFVEVWVDGQPITLRSGQKRTYMATMRPGVNGYLKFGMYKAPGTQTVTTYQDNIRVGSSYSAVQDR